MPQGLAAQYQTPTKRSKNNGEGRVRRFKRRTRT
jgi:hypothetical protein